MIRVGYFKSKDLNLRFQSLQGFRKKAFILITFLFCPALWAAQDAVVIVERAVVFSDEGMTSPVGFISRGKKVRIGELARNKGQVYPIVVSGKIAYIRAQDMHFQLDEINRNFSAERFKKNVEKSTLKSLIALGMLRFDSLVTAENSNGGYKDKANISWSGLALKGGGFTGKYWEFHVLGNYLSSTDQNEKINFLETGVGVGYRFLDLNFFYTRIDTQVFYIPWASYSLGDDFRVNGKGYSAGASLSAGVAFKSFALEGYVGNYLTKLGEFDVPAPYVAIQPGFTGNRVGLNLKYTF